MCHSETHSPPPPHTPTTLRLTLSCGCRKWSCKGANRINPLSVVAVALGYGRDLSRWGGRCRWARQQCTVGVLVSQSRVEAVIEMAKSFLNVRLNTRADVLDLIECGISDGT